jgi:hypothetical protein
MYQNVSKEKKVNNVSKDRNAAINFLKHWDFFHGGRDLKDGILLYLDDIAVNIYTMMESWGIYNYIQL